MKWTWVGLMLALVLVTLTAAPLVGQTNFPKLNSVEPNTAKPGDVLTVQGENLGKDVVQGIYLTDGQNDLRMDIIEQTATSIRFRVTDKVKPGKYNLMVLTRGDEPRLIEQPVKVTIE